MNILTDAVIAPIHADNCIARDGEDCCANFAWSNFEIIELPHTATCQNPTGYDCCANYPAY